MSKQYSKNQQSVVNVILILPSEVQVDTEFFIIRETEIEPDTLPYSFEPILDNSLTNLLSLYKNKLASLKGLEFDQKSNMTKILIFGKVGHTEMSISLVKVGINSLKRNEDLYLLNELNVQLACFTYLNEPKEYNNNIRVTLRKARENFLELKATKQAIICWFLESTYLAIFDRKFDEEIRGIDSIIESTDPSVQVRYFQKIADLYGKKGMKRKETFWLFRKFSIVAADKNFDMTDLLLFLRGKFKLDKISHSHNNLGEFEEDIVRKKLKTWRKTQYYVGKEGELKLFSKKRIEKKAKLSIKPIDIKGQNEQFFSRIQKELVEKTISHKNDGLTRIKGIMNILVSLGESLTPGEADELILDLKRNTKEHGGELKLNTESIPRVFKVKPIVPETRFSYNLKNTGNSTGIMSNPWLKKEYTDYFWTVNTLQQVEVEIFNKLTVSVEVADLQLVTENVKCDSLPVTLLLSERENKNVKLGIVPKEEGILKVIGLKYSVFGVECFQFIDCKGRTYYNLTDSSIQLNENKQVPCRLDNIKIFPETPKITIKCADLKDKEDLSAGEIKELTFQIENRGEKTVTSLEMYVYVFKKANLKSQHDKINFEVEIKQGESCTLEYKYCHSGNFKGVEFCFYVKGVEKESDLYKMFPYLMLPFSVRNETVLQINQLKMVEIGDNQWKKEAFSKIRKTKLETEVCYLVENIECEVKIENFSYRDTEISMYIGGNTFYKGKIGKGLAKNIKFEVPLTEKMEDLALDWNFCRENRKGTIALGCEENKWTVSKEFKSRLGVEGEVVWAELTNNSDSTREIEVTGCFYRVENDVLLVEEQLDDVVTGGTAVQEVVLEPQQTVKVQWELVCFDFQLNFSVALLDQGKCFISAKTLILKE